MVNRAVHDQTSASSSAARNAADGREPLVACNHDVVAVDVPEPHVERTVDVMVLWTTTDVHGDGDVPVNHVLQASALLSLAPPGLSIDLPWESGSSRLVADAFRLDMICMAARMHLALTDRLGTRKSSRVRRTGAESVIRKLRNAQRYTQQDDLRDHKTAVKASGKRLHGGHDTVEESTVPDVAVAAGPVTGMAYGCDCD